MPSYAEMLWLRSESQCNDRQVLPTLMIAHTKANGSATVAGDRCVRSGAWRTARPFRARFVSRALTRRQHIMINLMWRLATERRVRSILIVPIRIPHKLPTERFASKWHKDDPCAFVLEAQNESLHQRNAAVLTNSAEAGCDPIAITPVLEHIAPELLAFVADNVFWRRAGVDGSAFEEGLNR